MSRWTDSSQGKVEIIITRNKNAPIARATPAPDPDPEPKLCTECGHVFPVQDLAGFGADCVCASCKPAYVQRLREGAPTASANVAPEGEVFGGFWQRVAAFLIDLIITNILVFTVLGTILAFTRTVGAGTPPDETHSWMNFISYGLPLFYHSIFNWRLAATPGKMLFGLKVVTPMGFRITFGTAVARYLSLFLSGLMLGFGFLMVAFDDEKRALHDRICNTRVIRAAKPIF